MPLPSTLSRSVPALGTLLHTQLAQTLGISEATSDSENDEDNTDNIDDDSDVRTYIAGDFGRLYSLMASEDELWS